MSRSWLPPILALAAALFFAIGAIELPSQSLRDPAFAELFGLFLVALALAVKWLPE